MKQILSDFLNLIFPRPEGVQWKWVEIVLVLGILVFLIFITVLSFLDLYFEFQINHFPDRVLPKT